MRWRRHSPSLFPTSWRRKWRTITSTGCPTISSALLVISTTQSSPRLNTSSRTAGYDHDNCRSTSWFLFLVYFRYILEILELRGLSLTSAHTQTLSEIHQTGKKSSQTSREFYSKLQKEQVVGLGEKYRLDLEMFDYSIEPYLSWAR